MPRCSTTRQSISPGLALITERRHLRTMGASTLARDISLLAMQWFLAKARDSTTTICADQWLSRGQASIKTSRSKYGEITEQSWSELLNERAFQTPKRKVRLYQSLILDRNTRTWNLPRDERFRFLWSKRHYLEGSLLGPAKQVKLMSGLIW